MKRETCMAHPWPEWVECMQHLYKNAYFEEKGELDANRIRTACLHFACDRAHLIRENCERAYAKAHASEGGGTVDVMRLLLTYGLDLVTGVVENKCCLNKVVKESVRRLLKEMVEHSKKELTSDPSTAVSTKWDSSVQESSTHQGEDHIRVSIKQGDWKCSKNFAQNTKCLHCNRLFPERQRKLREDLALKKGGWLCDKCNFFLTMQRIQDACSAMKTLQSDN